MRRTCVVAFVAAVLVSGAVPANAQTPEPAEGSGWKAVRLELGGGWGHAFPGTPCTGDCGAGLRPGTGWLVQGFARYGHVGFGLVHESATFPWAIDAPSYKAPGASITTGATYGSFRAWLYENAVVNPYMQVGIGAANYEVNEPSGVCQMNPGMAWQGGVGLDVRVLRSVKYNIAWSTRTGAPEVVCNWSLKHPSGVPVPPDRAVTTHSLTMGASIVIGDGWW
jgi:opacity protein-like surface antigen